MTSENDQKFQAKRPDIISLTGCLISSLVLSVCWGVENTQISTPGRRKQVQSDNVARLDLNRTFG